MAIRMRRGNEADFDPSKMLPGEWAVSTDTKYVRMCFSPGIVLRMATYEAFESDMAEIRKILLECQSIQTAVKLIQQNVTNSELVIENYVKEAKQYRDEAEQFRNEASMFAPEGYEDLVKNVSDNTVKIDTIIEKAELNIKNNAKGSNIHLTDSADSNVVALELYGKTEQNAYTGKNQLDCSGLVETTKNNVTFTPVKDENGMLQYINVNGTASADTTYSLQTVETEIGESYTISGCPSDGSNTSYRLRAQGYANDIGNGATWTTISTITNVGIIIEVFSGTVCNNLKFYPMISKEGGEYEPYVGGTPSPNPSYPQEIKSVKGKNLLDCRGLTEKTDNGGTFTPVKDENGNLLYVEVKGTFTNVTNYVIASLNDLKTNYTNLIGKDIILSGTSGDVEVNWQGLTTEGIGATSGIVGDFTTRTNESSNRIRIVVGANKTVNEKIYPMIRLASITDDTYVPYGLLRIKTIGSQLVNVDNAQIGKAWNGDVNTARAVVIVPCKPNTTYTVNCDTTVVDGIYYFEKESKNDRIATANMPITGVTTITTSANSNFIVIQFNKENITIDDVKNAKIMLNKGTIALPYQPYQSTEITLSEPIELNGFNGVYDVVTSDGVTKKIKRRRLLRSDGWGEHANGWYYSQSITDFKYGNSPVGTVYSVQEALCSHLVYENNRSKIIDEKSQGITMWYDSSYGGYRVAVYLFDMTCDEWVTFLDENEVYLLYELATPTTEELQSDFTALKTFYPETHVSNNADCDMSITYTADAKNYIDNKIALLTTAIYNNI